jgi:hypothetical protein
LIGRLGTDNRDDVSRKKLRRRSGDDEGRSKRNSGTRDLRR